MIVRENESYFIMVKQHDHAILSGEIAKHLNKELFIYDSLYDAALIAISEHDRSWVRLDETLIWNDRKNAPFSFMDYPLAKKLPFYKTGLDEIEEINQYAGLLCSLHYASFKHIKSSKEADSIEFYKNEVLRQQRIKENLRLLDESTVLRHFKLLQLCDEISLYVCLNEDGVSKNNEHPWYKEGFNTIIDNQIYNARWRTKGEISLKPNPFVSNFRTSLKLKKISKELVSRYGINKAYQETEWVFQDLLFVSG